MDETEDAHELLTTKYSRVISGDTCTVFASGKPGEPQRHSYLLVPPSKMKLDSWKLAIEPSSRISSIGSCPFNKESLMTLIGDACQGLYSAGYELPRLVDDKIPLAKADCVIEDLLQTQPIIPPGKNDPEFEALISGKTVVIVTPQSMDPGDQIFIGTVEGIRHYKGETILDIGKQEGPEKRQSNTCVNRSLFLESWRPGQTGATVKLTEHITGNLQKCGSRSIILKADTKLFLGSENFLSDLLNAFTAKNLIFST